MAASRPPELSMDAKWEAAIDLTLRRLMYGSLAGGAAGLLLFRASKASFPCFSPPPLVLQALFHSPVESWPPPI